jgi:hypothetical protein
VKRSEKRDKLYRHRDVGKQARTKQLVCQQSTNCFQLSAVSLFLHDKRIENPAASPTPTPDSVVILIYEYIGDKKWLHNYKSNPITGLDRP